MNIQQINEKRIKLVEAKKYLKSQFIGLDNIIEQIVDNIEAWYLLPEMINRPVIVNLWGLTGVGKTDLVRKLVKFLSFSDKYVEIQLDTKGSGSKSIKSLLLDSNIQEGENGIILLDEIQRFRSINEQGEEILDKDFQDVWMLLSDGRFNGNHVKSDIIEEVLDIMYSREAVSLRENNEVASAPKFQLQNDGSGQVKLVQIEQEKKPTKLVKKKYNISTWRASRLKKLARLKESIEQIMQWTEDEMFETLSSKVRNSSNDDFEIDYSKSLIFVSGNIDEAYSMASMVNDADIGADILHNHSNKINVIDIKKCLKKRFKPEQIARLGNTHILYPSLSSNNYNELIKKSIETTLKFTKKVLDIKNITYEDNIVQFIYRNGVFPAQGVRPVFSTINGIFNNVIPKIILFAKENRIKDLKLKIIDSCILTLEGHEKFRISLNGSIDKIKREITIDKKTLISVHEAGHAIVYANLFGVSPQEIKSSISCWGGGYMIGNLVCSAREHILNEVTVLLAGQVAEKIVFGDNCESGGASSDVLKATEKVMYYIRNCGLGEQISYVVEKGNQSSSSLNSDTTQSNIGCEKILKEQRERVNEILLNNKKLFKETSKKLISNGNITPEEFQSMAKNFNLKIEVINSEKELCPNYKEKCDKFFGEVI